MFGLSSPVGPPPHPPSLQFARQPSFLRLLLNFEKERLTRASAAAATAARDGRGVNRRTVECDGESKRRSGRETGWEEREAGK